MSAKLMLLPLTFLFLFQPPSALADCTSPAAVAGILEYLSASNTVKYCNGTNWIDTNGTALTTCASVTAGTITYDSGSGVYKFCDGSNWKSMKGSNLGACATGAGFATYSGAISKYTFCDGSVLWDMGGMPAAPSAPTISSPASSPTYTSGSSLEISGGCVAGNTVTLSGSSSQTATCTALGAYTFTVSNSVDGTYNYSVSQTDAYSQTSATASQQWVRDTIAPDTVTITSPGYSYQTSINTTTVSGTCEAYATVYFSGGSDSGNTACSATGTYSFTATQSVDNTYSYSIYQKDRALNSSSSITFTLIRNSTALATPLLTAVYTYTVAPLPNPFYTTINSFNVVISCVTGSTIWINDVEQTSPLCASSSFTYTVPTQTSDGTWTYTFYQVDSNGQKQSGTLSFTWVRDNVAPATPVITTPAANPYTASGNLTLKGTCETAATVTLSGSDSQTVTCVASAFQFTVTKSIDATYTFSVKQTDRAGNNSSSASFTWIRDSGTPPNPTITTPAVSPYYSNTATLTLSGVCETGNTVTLSGVNAADVTTPANSLTQTCVNSAFSYVISKADGSYTLSLTQTNSSARTSGATSIVYIKDTVVPVTTNLVTPSGDNLALTATITFTVTETNLLSTQCSIDNGLTYSTCTSPKVYTNLVNSTTYNFKIKSIDLAGNEEVAISRSWTQKAYKTIALYHFDSANQTLDSSSYTGANLNTLTNSTSVNSTATKKIGDASQQIVPKSGNTAAKHAYVAHTPTQATLTTQATFEAWINVTSLGAASFISKNASSTATTNDKSWDFGLAKSGTKYYLNFVGCVNPSGCSSTGLVSKNSSQVTLTTGTWYHVAAVYDNGTVYFYLNGAAIGSAALAANTPLYVATGNGMIVGGNGVAGGTPANVFDGYIDEMRISQVVRYTGAFTAPTAAFGAD